MATDHPNDPTPPGQPNQPKPSPEEALFDDLPLSGTPTDEPLPPGSADELLVFDDAPPPVDPADALADLPLADPMEGSSGWLSDPATDPKSVDELGLLTDASDIFSDAGRSGSDILRAGPGSDNSNIFTGAPGSSLFSLPTPPAGKAPGSDPDADLFEGLERSASGSEGFPTRVGDPSSQVSLDALSAGAEEDPASIFTPAPPGGPDVEINIAESSLVAGEDADALAFADDVTGTASHIFTNTKLPKPGEPPPTSESAVINWAEPGDWGDNLPVVANSATSETDVLAAAAREELAAAPEPEPAEVVEPARPRSRSRVADAEPAARGSSRGWVGGGALGLLVGVGACAGAYFGGLLPAKSAPAVSQAPVRPAPPPPAGPTLDDAHALLAAGDPGRALKAFDAAGDAATPEAKAARGQARWQARVRDLAATDTAVLANDPQLQRAEADLQAVLASADTLKTAPEKQAAVRAALHLGLLKELTGDPAAAAKVYTDAAGKFPASRRVFDTALARLRLAQPNGKLGRLLPRQADELAQLAAVALVLIQQPEAEQPAADEEAGFRFWEAVNRAAAGDYANAIEAIDQAKVLHDRRRLKLVGRGLNPLSDPLEQIFSRACDDLRDYWTLKRELYGNPQIGPLVRKEGVANFLAGVTTLRAEANRSALAAKEAAGLKTANADLQARLADAGKKLQTALGTATKAERDKDGVAKELAAASQELRERKKQLTDAEAKAADALAKQKAAETLLASAVNELKANNLIDAKDDVPAALAKLPAVLKRASAAATSADAKRAAEALLKANTATEAARADAKNARAKADQLAAEMKEAEAGAATKLAAAQKDVKAARAATATEVKMAVAAARSEAEVKQAQLAEQARVAKKQLQSAQQEFARKLAEQEETFRRQMADVRAGVVVPLSAGERAAQYRAAQSYSRGVELYFAGRYADAESAFAAAARDDAADARYWYFLGLSQFNEGKRESADAAFKKGAELEARNQPSARVLNAALERVQGAARQALNAHRP